MAKILQDLERDPYGFDRHWTELVRLFEKGSSTEQLVFVAQRGVSVLNNVFTSYLEGQQRTSSSPRVLLGALNVLRLAARSHPAVSIHLANSRVAPLLLGLLAQRLGVKLSLSDCISL